MSSRRLYSIFVRNIQWTLDRYDIREYFNKFGRVTNVSYPYDQNTGLPKGFAIVYFSDRQACQKTLENQNHKINNSRVTVYPSIDYTEPNLE